MQRSSPRLAANRAKVGLRFTGTRAAPQACAAASELARGLGQIDPGKLALQRGNSRLESGQIELHREASDLYELVADLVQRLGSLEEGRQLTIEYPEWVPPARVDRARIQRALMNLLTNALKYSPPESPVSVSIEREAEQVVVSITDHGAGIPPEDLPRLFQRYYRAPTAGKAQGLGLGLYITRLIVEAHGGSISVRSEPGVGSTFRLCLPRA